MKGAIITAILLTSFPALAEDPTNSTEVPLSKDALQRTGILFWKFHLPNDLEESEYLDTEWRIGGKIVESTLHFKGIPRGQDVTVTLWTASMTQYAAEKGWNRTPKTLKRPEGMPFVVTFQNEKGILARRTGVLNIPEGYEQIYSLLPSGGYVDSAWLLLQFNPEREGEEDNLASLDAVWRWEEEEE